MQNPAQKFYDRISHAYDLIADGGEDQARQQGLEMLNVQTGESVLELGYGTGHSLVQLARSVGNSGKVVGIDISHGMQEVAAQRLKQEGLLDQVDLRVAEVPPIPLDSSSFDVINMSFTLELFPMELIPAVLQECRRVLKPGGRLGVVSMAKVVEGETESLLERTYVWLHAHFPHFIDCQPIPLAELLQQAGFQLKNSQRISLFTMPVALVVAQNS